MEAQEKEGGREMREYRKGNWTVQETMILIEAKKMDDERRKISRSKTAQNQQQQPLRWKWVEEYCWRKACQRSQNQCNDKWDNLMRDYKKVREYERNLTDDRNNNNINNNKSYWEMNRGERKEKGLPTNMLPQIYQALYDVVEKPAPVQLLPPEMPPVALLPPPPPPPPLPLLPYYPHQQQPQPSPISSGSESEHSESESPAKRRKSRATTAAAAEGGTSEAAMATEAATATATHEMGGPHSSSTSADHHLQEVGNAISRSATVIAKAIQASDERDERRHREIVGLHQTSLRLQESRTEIHRQGLNAFTDAINNLANSILQWANSHKNQGPSS